MVVQCIAYADDVVLIAQTERTFIVLEREPKKVGLELNQDKTEYMLVSRRKGVRLLGIRGEEEDDIYERYENFKYLGVLLTDENKMFRIIHQRI